MKKGRSSARSAAANPFGHFSAPSCLRHRRNPDSEAGRRESRGRRGILGARGMVPRFRGGGAPMRVVCVMLVLTIVVSIATGTAAAANYTQETLDRYLR